MADTFTFEIKNCFTGAVMYEASLDVSLKTRSLSFQLGAAVKAAVAAGANLRDANLSDANLRGAYLRGAYLRDANLSDANLRDANLSDANLSGAYLRDANLRGAYLRDAYLSDANLSGAYLRGAYLRGANLSGAYLRGAYLSDANLSGANLSGAKVTRLLASASRVNDQYQFFAWERAEGGVWITAGCRAMSPADYRAHVREEYPDTDKAEETLAILDFLELRAKQMGVAEPSEVEAA